MRVSSYHKALAVFAAGSAMSVPAPNSDIIGHQQGFPEKFEQERLEFLQHLCVHASRDAFEDWIVQVPANLWQDYESDRQACTRWIQDLDSREICGLWIHKCGAIGKGEGVEKNRFGRLGWLQIRVTTCIGPNEKNFHKSMATMFGGGDHNPNLKNYHHECHHAEFDEALPNRGKPTSI